MKVKIYLKEIWWIGTWIDQIDYSAMAIMLC